MLPHAFSKNINLHFLSWQNDKVLEFVKNNPNYVVCGNTKYLGIEGKENSVIQGMLALLKVSEPIDNYLALKPVYMSGN